MVQDTKKFYYYRIKGKQGRQKWIIDVLDEINQKELLNNNIIIKTNSFSYTFDFEKRGNLFFGTMTKAKGANGYEFRSTNKRQWGSLEDKTGEGYARELENGVSYFVLGKEGYDLIALVQKGYQTSGIDKLITFFNEFFKTKDIKVAKELLKTKKSIEAIRKIVTQDKLVSIDVRLKRNDPTISEGCSDVVKALYKLNQNGIQIYVGAKVIPTQDGVLIRAKEMLEKFIKLPKRSPSEDIIEVLFEEVDFSEIFESIKIAAIDVESGAEVKQDILDDLEHEKINIDREFSIFSETQKCSLCLQLEQKITLVMRERND